MQKFFRTAKIEEIKIIQQVQDKHNQCYLKETIQLIEELDVDTSFCCHEILQLFKGMSLFKTEQIKLGFQCFEDIIQEILSNKNMFEEIDLIIWTIYQLEAQYYFIQKAEDLNDRFLAFIEDFLIHNQELDSYQMAIYQFAKGMFIYIDTYREGLDKECINLLEQSYQNVEDFKSEILISLSWILYKDKQYQKAYYYYQTLYDLNPRIPCLANNFAIALQFTKEFDKAEKLFLEEEKMRGYNEVIINNMAQFYSNQKNKEKVKEYFEKLVQIKPLTAKICKYYGQYLVKTGNLKQAKEYFEKGIEIDPEYFGNYEELSDIQINQNYIQALEYAIKCCQFFPKDGYFQTLLGNSYNELGNFHKAKKCFKLGKQFKNYQYLKIYSSSKLAFIYFSLNKYHKSIQQYFKTCNYKKIEGLEFDREIYISCQFMELIPLEETIQLITQQEGLNLIPKFSSFAQVVKNHKLKLVFMQKLEIHRQLLFLTVYSKLVIQNLVFQSKIIHWDLFID